MTNRLVAILRFLFALSVIGGVAWAIYLIVAAILSSLTKLESDVAVAIVAASATVIVSVLTLVISKILEGRASITQELRAKKTPIYENIISTLYKLQFAEKLGEEPLSEQELMKFIADIMEKLTIWDSDGVIRAFSDFRLATVRGADSVDILFIYENLLLEIRKDLGHKNTNLKRGMILSLTVNDIDKYLPR